MSYPSFDPHGYLEAGIHLCTMEELEELFGWNNCRRRLLAQLREFVETELMQAAGQQAPLVLDGTFVTRHESPAEIVAVLLLDEIAEEHFWNGADLYSSHQTVRSRYQIRLYVHSATYGMDALSRIQGIDTVELLEKGLHHKHSKGVVRLN
jgi:hypothetical protein